MTDPDPLTAFLGLTLYAVVADLGKHGIASADLCPAFDDACDRWVEHMEDGERAEVLEIQIGRPAILATAAAARRVAQWHINRRQDLPDWLSEKVAA